MAQLNRGYGQRQQVPNTYELSIEERLTYLANLIVDELERGLANAA